MARFNLWLIPGAALLAGCLAANTSAVSSTRTVDGNDWTLMTNVQRDGLVTGYFDCYVLGQQRVGPSGSRFEWASRITAYYQANPQRMLAPFGKAFLDVTKSFPDAKVPTRADSYLDGEMWRQMLPETRIQYVQGFLMCQSASMSLPPPADIARYEREMSVWYGVSKTEPDVVNLDRVKDKMGDVLSKIVAQ